MINSISSKTCGNVYSILNELNVFDQIPEDKQNYIIKHKDNHELKFNKNIPLQFQINDKETMVVLSYLFLKYINKNADTKKYLLDKYNKNEISYQGILREKYNPDKIFENGKYNINNAAVGDELALVEVKDNFISRFFKKIKSFFIRGNN